MVSSLVPRSDLVANAMTRATAWAQDLGRKFQRLALFEIQGANANVAWVQGMSALVVGRPLSLLHPSPLRAALDAASPIIEAGKSPNAQILHQHLEIGAPRAFAVIPYVHNGQLVAMAYVDCQQAPLPLKQVADLLCQYDRSILSAAKATSELPIRWHRPRPRLHPTPKRPKLKQLPPRQKNWEPEPSAPTPSALLRPPMVTPSEFAPSPSFNVYSRSAISRPIMTNSHRKKRRVRTSSLFIAAAFLLSFAILGILPLTPLSTDGQTTIDVQIPENATMSQIANILATQQLVRHAPAFRLYARLTNRDRKLQAGVYTLHSGQWAWDLLNELKAGRILTTTVTFPEGLTLAEISKIIARHELARPEEIEQAAANPQLLNRFHIAGSNLEGYLFPDTYIFPRGISAEKIVETMVAQFFVRIATLPGVSVTSTSPQELHHRVVLASIVERESRVLDEMNTIAGVFQNRLNRDMRLESCATVQYVIGENKEHLQLADIRTPSPYNTYLQTGLPPGAIANPGLAALRAAFDPEPHDYLFFFARNDSSHRHVFSRTFAEHQKAQKSWQQE